MKRKNSLTLFKVLAVAAFFISVFIFLKILLPTVPATLLLPFVPETSTLGYVQVSANAYTDDYGVVVLSANCYGVEGVTEKWIAESILEGAGNRTPFRPDAHDVIRDVFKSLDVEVVMVKVVDIVNNTFIGRLVLKQGNRIVSLDIRPSNAVAVAVRVGAPIYMREDLLKNYGKKIC